jgi:hypothetical protein
MTILTLDWIKEAPEKFRPGMAVRTKNGRVVLVGDDTSTMRLALLKARFVEWAWWIKPYEVTWLAGVRDQHAKGRSEQ